MLTLWITCRRVLRKASRSEERRDVAKRVQRLGFLISYKCSHEAVLDLGFGLTLGVPAPVCFAKHHEKTEKLFMI